MEAPAVMPPDKTVPGSDLPPRFKPIRSVSDGLQPGEGALLDALRSSGAPDSSDPDVRVVSLGHSAIRRQTGSFGRSTIKRLLRSLARKQCIRMRQAPTILSPASYEVFSDGRILSDWQRRGWTQVYRDRRAVVIIGLERSN
jgi:hypothetical protein